MISLPFVLTTSCCLYNSSFSPADKPLRRERYVSNEPCTRLVHVFSHLALKLCIKMSFDSLSRMMGSLHIPSNTKNVRLASRL